MIINEAYIGTYNNDIYNKDGWFMKLAGGGRPRKVKTFKTPRIPSNGSVILEGNNSLY